MTGPADVIFVRVDAGAVDAHWALKQYFDELDRRFVGGFKTDEALDEATPSFNPPSGLFVLAMIGDDIVGCGGVQWIDGSTGEIRRMWVDPARRT